MATTLKIKFGGSKIEIKPYWLPVVIELQRNDVEKIVRFALHDFENDLKDDPQKGICYYEIPDLQEGLYSLTIRESHMGHPIIYDQKITIQGKEVEYKILEGEGDPDDATLQPNTYGMDFIADAPYRLQKGCPYVPVLVHIKDIKRGKIRIKDIFLSSSPDGHIYNPLQPGSIFKVLDADGTVVEENGKPAVLRCDPGKKYETVKTDP